RLGEEVVEVQESAPPLLLLDRGEERRAIRADELHERRRERERGEAVSQVARGRERRLAFDGKLAPAAGASARLPQVGRRTPRGERLEVQRRQRRELLEERAHLPSPRVGALRGAGRGPELLEEAARILDRRARLAEDVGRDARVVEKRARGVE